VARLREAKHGAHLAFYHLLYQRQLLALVPARPEVPHHTHGGEVADDTMLVLQIVEQPEAFGRQVFSDRRHPELRVRVACAAVFSGKREAVDACFVGEAGGLVQQGDPFVSWKALVVPVCSGVFAAVVEEALVVVTGLEGGYFRGDEGVEMR